MKRKVFLTGFTALFMVMVYQMVIAKTPAIINEGVNMKMAYLTEPDTSKKDTTMVEVELMEEEMGPQIYSRKYIPPRELREPKQLAKKKRKEAKAKAKKDMLATDTPDSQ